MIVSLSVN